MSLITPLNPLGIASKCKTYATFASGRDGVTSPYAVLGKWADFDEIRMTCVVEDHYHYNQFLNSRAGYRPFFGYNNSALMIGYALTNATITPNPPWEELADGQKRTFIFKYDATTAQDIVAVGGSHSFIYTRRKKIYKIQGLKNGVLVADASPVLVDGSAMFFNKMTNEFLEQFGIFQIGYD